MKPQMVQVGRKLRVLQRRVNVRFGDEDQLRAFGTPMPSVLFHFNGNLDALRFNPGPSEGLTAHVMSCLELVLSGLGQ